ncbi:MAG: hypothetical protein NC395_04455 [Prevotella sp.]|nr:hypothetical protein [Prevotella sp.]
MMQDKNNLDDMAKKYKEEMMRLYSKKPKSAVQTVPAAVSSPPSGQTSHAAASVASEKQAQTVRLMPAQTAASSRSAPSASSAAVHKQPAAASSDGISEERRRELSQPPMPEIPQNYPDAGVKSAETSNSPAPKFPPAEELIRGETTERPARTSAENTVPENRSAVSEEHNQGNYTAAEPPAANTDSSAEPPQVNESYPDENTDFSSVNTGENFTGENPPDMSGQGYLQIEVTTASGAIPVRDATVIITEKTDGVDALIGMVVTDENGTTPVVPLPAPPQALSEAPDPSERPYSEYNISVYKKGFYSIPQLTVPVFDTIKSIQPVSVIPLAEFERSGAEVPN